ncbi:hypothetical protein COHA_004411 [Chlorella ohadii]|uniref:Acyltransferase n=1 Tax=Chlorella ohadii TaxID=2649997 RepID=A0AAD5H780_9CHLO|nr:hypothetical protein COHA_004411 [Chlorella ohadii]
MGLHSFLALLGALWLPARYLMLFGGWGLYFWLLYSKPVLRIPLALYLVYIFSPAGKRALDNNRWPLVFRRWYPMYKWAAWWAPAQLVKTADLDPAGRYLLAVHPHGVLGSFPLMAIGTEALGFGRLFPGIRVSLGVFDSIMYTPFVRELCFLHGWCGVDRLTLLARLRQGPGSAVGIYVGGAAEAVYAEPGTLDLVLLRRKGFIKVAIEGCASLVPVLGFGENDQYHRIKVLRGGFVDRLQVVTKKYGGFTLPLAYGRGILGLSAGPWPEKVPLAAVVGAPLELPPFKGDLRSEAGRAHVDACHALYCAALQKLYDEHKDKYAPHRTRDMRFVE